MSTGLRINSGKDDPAGLIAANALGSEITSSNQAISNTQQATNMIDTANSALGQVSTLLNDIQGLVTQAANTGGDERRRDRGQPVADRFLAQRHRPIAQTTAFQGTNLLDGSLGFVVGNWGGSHAANVQNLQVNQANLSNGALERDAWTSPRPPPRPNSIPPLPPAARRPPPGTMAFSAGGTAQLGGQGRRLGCQRLHDRLRRNGLGWLRASAGAIERQRTLPST